MGRHGQVLWQWRLQRLFGLEEKQYAVAAPEKCVALAHFPDRLQTHNAVIEPYSLRDIADIERRFKDACCAHG
ncbi:hypothetical protein D3C80_2120350 [compost metagenome]